MRKILFLCIGFSCTPCKAVSQSIIRTAESKSGLLVGTQNISDFAGITYARGNDQFIFNYRTSKQRTPKAGYYPNSSGFNIELGTELSKGKTQLIGGNKWQGGLLGGLVYSYMTDKTRSGTVANTIVKDVYLAPGGKVKYETMRECEEKDGSPCIKSTDTTIAYTPNPIRQHTVYISLEDQVNRIDLGQLTKLNNDTTFLSTSDRMQNTFNAMVGWNHLRQVSKKWFASFALSLQFALNNASTKNMKSKSFVTLQAGYFNASDSSAIVLKGAENPIPVGDPAFEVVTIPRFDLFLRYDWGDKKPYPGLILAISPIKSSLQGVNTRWNFAIGPSFSLPGLPDQVLFALMSEWLEDKDNKLNYTLSLHASYPIKFK